ncbi:MAG TPA: CPBP family intramembrane glutamic endopeptidase [Candidatus Sulfotelmatobacter sp.]|nr:CPBP family intramembrane glutamic endopeptidase [Candidatus Sulfotelmatobacter sp.]
MATTNSATFAVAAARESRSIRDLAELTVGFGAIIAVLWLPTREQLVFAPIALLGPLVLVLLRRPALAELGLHLRGFISSLWILPAAVAFSMVSIFAAQKAGMFHSLYQADLTHVGGYVLWTIYQQFLLQDYFMPRLTRVLSSDVAVMGAALLFAVAHLPNLPLALATLVWGAVSCALFRHYRSIYVLGLAQGLLGLCFAVCIPDALHHHMRVGLGYLHYRP